MSFNPLKISVLVSVVLNMASKSFTHLFTAIGRFQTQFKIMCTTEDSQITLLAATFDVWKNHQQLLVVLIEKLLKAEIIDTTAVANWVLSSEMTDELMK